MEIAVKLKYLRIAPRKVRLVSDLVRGKKIEEAQKVLDFTVKKANLPIIKLINSAIASAKNNYQIDESNLYISKIFVDEGPKYKRWRARSRGRAAQIKKRTSSITLIISDIDSKKTKKAKVKKSTTSKKEIKETKIIEKQDKKEAKEKTNKEQIKFKPKLSFSKPKTDSGNKKIFRRKAF